MKRTLLAKGDSLNKERLIYHIDVPTFRESYYVVELMACRFECLIKGGFWDWNTEAGELWSGIHFMERMLEKPIPDLLQDNFDYVIAHPGMHQSFIHLFKGKTHRFANYFVRRVHRAWANIGTIEKNKSIPIQVQGKMIEDQIHVIIFAFTQIRAYNRLVWKHEGMDKWLVAITRQAQVAFDPIFSFYNWGQTRLDVYEGIQGLDQHFECLRKQPGEFLINHKEREEFLPRWQIRKMFREGLETKA